MYIHTYKCLHMPVYTGVCTPVASPGHGTDLILILTHLKAGTPATEIDDLSTLLYKKESRPGRPSQAASAKS